MACHQDANNQPLERVRLFQVGWLLTALRCCMLELKTAWHLVQIKTPSQQLAGLVREAEAERYERRLVGASALGHHCARVGAREHERLPSQLWRGHADRIAQLLCERQELASIEWRGGGR